MGRRLERRLSRRLSWTLITLILLIDFFEILEDGSEGCLGR
ncbi:hypothetical protein QFZ51_006082 [Chitinophaga sp. W3I9]